MKKAILTASLFSSAVFLPTYGDSFLSVNRIKAVDKTNFNILQIVINTRQLEDILKTVPYGDKIVLPTLRVESVSLSSKGKVVLNNLSGSGIFLQQAVVNSKNGTLEVELHNFRMDLSKALKNYPSPLPLGFKNLFLKKDAKGNLSLEIKDLSLFGGSIEKISLGPDRILNVYGVNGIPLPKLLELANYFKPLNGINLNGSLYLKSASVDLNNLTVKVNSFNLKQGEYRGIFLNRLTYSPEGLFIKGKIRNFKISLPSQAIKIKGHFEKNELLKATNFELRIKTNLAKVNAKGSFSFNGKDLKLIADKVNVNLSSQKGQGKEKPSELNEKPKPKGVNLPKITIPDLPLNSVQILVKDLVVKVPINVPYFKLRPFEVKNIELSYEGKGVNIYTFHVGVCYSDLWGYRDKVGNISFLFTVPFVPVSAIKGCFLKEISHPYLKDVFTSGYLNLFLGGYIPEGKLGETSGFLTLSLLNGYFYTEGSLHLPGKLSLAYSLASSAFNFIGIDLSEFDYNLYLSGDFRLDNSNLRSFLDTTVFVQKPKTFLFRGITKLIYNFQTSKGTMEIEGSTALPWGSWTPIKQIKRF